MQRRNYSIDLLRSTMMFIGIVYHVLLGLLPDSSTTWKLPTTDHSKVLFVLFNCSADFIHTFRMPLFFFLSGLMASGYFARHGTKAFIVNRVKRIGIPLVIFWCVLVMVPQYTSAVGNAIKHGDNFFAAMWNAFRSGSLLYVQLEHLWFIYYLMLFVLMMPFVSRLTNSAFSKYLQRINATNTCKIHKQALAIAALSIVPLTLLYFGKFMECPKWMSVNIQWTRFAFYFFYFVVGWFFVVFKINLDVFKNSANRLLGAALIFTGIRFGLMYSNDLRFSAHLVFYAASIWLYIFAFIGLFQKITVKRINVAKYISDSSYWVYLIHVPILEFLEKTFFPQMEYGAFTGLLLATIFLSMFSYRYLVRPTWIGTMLSGKSYPLEPIPEVATFVSKGSQLLILARERHQVFSNGVRTIRLSLKNKS